MTRRAKLLVVLLGLPLLLLVACTYQYFRPDLLLDPITRAPLQAAEHRAGWWRTLDVDLMPDPLTPGLSLNQVNARLERAGYTLRDDSLMSESYRSSEREQGYSHTFTRNGRWRIACGETLFVRVGIERDMLAKAAAYGAWTCL